MVVTSSNNQINLTDYDSDYSDSSSHSCTSASSSEDGKIPTLVRVSKDIMDKMENKEYWLVLPKLSQRTMNFWKYGKHENQIDSVMTTPTSTDITVHPSTSSANEVPILDNSANELSDFKVHPPTRVIITPKLKNGNDLNKLEKPVSPSLSAVHNSESNVSDNDHEMVSPIGKTSE